MIKKLSNSNQSSSEMTSNQSDIYLVEAFLEENFLFRRNLLSGKQSLPLSLKTMTKL